MASTKVRQRAKIRGLVYFFKKGFISRNFLTKSKVGSLKGAGYEFNYNRDLSGPTGILKKLDSYLGTT